MSWRRRLNLEGNGSVFIGDSRRLTIGYFDVIATLGIDKDARLRGLFGLVLNNIRTASLTTHIHNTSVTRYTDQARITCLAVSGSQRPFVF